MHIHKEELNSFSNETMSTQDMITFLEHIDSCNYCLEQLMQTEQAQAPSYLKHQTMKKASSPEVQASRAALVASRKMQLFYYSLQTAVGVIAALFLLFGAAHMELPLLHGSPPVYKEFTADRQLPPERNKLYDFVRGIGNGISEGTGALTQYLNDFPNNLLNGGK